MDKRVKAVVLKDGTTFSTRREFAEYLEICPTQLSRKLKTGATFDQIKEEADAFKLGKQQRVDEEVEKFYLTEKAIKEGRPSITYPEIIAMPDGSLFSTRRRCFIGAEGTDKAGYKRISLSRGLERTKYIYVHFVVCEAWHGPKPEGRRMTVDHINRLRQDNRPENLRWVEQKDNNRNRGNHTYHVVNGVSKIFPEWAEEFGWTSTEERYFSNLVHVQKISLETALLARKRYLEQGVPWKGAPLEIPSLSVTGVWFPSKKAACEFLGASKKTVNTWMREGRYLEEMKKHTSLSSLRA